MITGIDLLSIYLRCGLRFPVNFHFGSLLPCIKQPMKAFTY